MREWEHTVCLGHIPRLQRYSSKAPTWNGYGSLALNDSRHGLIGFSVYPLLKMS